MTHIQMMSGNESSENSVVIKMPCEASFSFPLYSVANSAVVFATGMQDISSRVI